MEPQATSKSSLFANEGNVKQLVLNIWWQQGVKFCSGQIFAAKSFAAKTPVALMALVHCVCWLTWMLRERERGRPCEINQLSCKCLHSAQSLSCISTLNGSAVLKGEPGTTNKWQSQVVFARATNDTATGILTDKYRHNESYSAGGWWILCWFLSSNKLCHNNTIYCKMQVCSM